MPEERQPTDRSVVIALLYFFRNLSTRPSVSISFCLPVKNGWQTEQMSSLMFVFGGPGLERFAAGAVDLRQLVVGMNSLFHGSVPP